MAFFKSKTSNTDDNTNALSEINVVPLVDVMLVLLIIFMVTAPLSIGGINIELPQSKSKSININQNRIVLSINKKGEYYIDKMKIPSSDLEIKLKSIFEFRDKKELYIRADRSVQYGKVMDAMTAAKLSGVNKISMLAQSLTNNTTLK